MNDNLDDFDPFEFKCNNCSKKQVFTMQKIEEIKQINPLNNDECFILCESCKKWHMEPPTYTMTYNNFDDF